MLGDSEKKQIPGDDPYWVYPDESTADILAEKSCEISDGDCPGASNPETELLNTSIPMNEGDNVNYEISVPETQSQLLITTNWPGSTVDLELVDPTGQIITPMSAENDKNIYHKKGLNFEFYGISDPKPGTWDVNVVAVDLPTGGENVTVKATSRSVVTKTYLPTIAISSAN